jgi:hypothetical protein
MPTAFLYGIEFERTILRRRKVDAEFFCRYINEPFNCESDFRPAGAAVGLRRNRIGKDRNGTERSDGNIIVSGDQSGPFAQR